MLQQAEAGRRMSRAAFEAEAPQLRIDLRNAQFALRGTDWPVVLLIAGDDRLGCEAIVEVLHRWLDARYMDTRVFGPPPPEALDRPRFWRYWQSLPRAGRIGILLGGWASNTVAERATQRLYDSEFARRVARIRNFERTVVDDGAVLVKFWLHLPKKDHKRRTGGDPRGDGAGWGLDHRDWAVYDDFDAARPIVERFLADTHQPEAPWHVVESTDPQFRDWTVLQTILNAVQDRLHHPAPPERQHALRPIPVRPLSTIDLTATLSASTYATQLAENQRRLRKFARDAREQRLTSLMVFEGWDGAGKGGIIRRLTGAMHACDYDVIAPAPPRPDDTHRHYLWHFWSLLPPGGRMIVFDRSWYGRVLHDRVERRIRPNAWRRAFSEIVDFEAELADHGVIITKFWLHLDAAEQTRRLEAREHTPYDKHDDVADEYPTPGRFDEYASAVEEMVARTHSVTAPWHIISANDKRWARIQVLKKVNRALKRALRQLG